MKKSVVSLCLFLLLSNFVFAKEKVFTNYQTDFLTQNILKDYNFILSSCFNENQIIDYEKVKLNADRMKKILDFFYNHDLKFQNSKEEIIFYIAYVNIFLIDHVAKQYPLKSLNIFIKDNDIRALRKIENIRIPFKDKTKIRTIGQIIMHVITLDKVVENYGNVRTIFSFDFLSKDAPGFNFLLFNVNLLNRNLDEAVRLYLSDKNIFEIDRDKDIVYLSGFFKRYISFFNVNFNKNNIIEIKNAYLSENDLNIVKFLLDYVNPNDKVFLKNNLYKIVYKRDDFSLKCIS